MWRLAIAICLAGTAGAAQALEQIEAKLDIKIAADGSIGSEITLTNRTGRSLCMLPGGWDEGLAYDADGHVLGHPVETTLLWPDTLNVVWADEWPHAFPAVINSGGKLNANEARRFVKAGFHFDLYDCVELIEDGRMKQAQVKYQRDIETDAITREAPAPP